MSKRLIKKFRWLFTFLIIALLIFMKQETNPSSDAPIQFYASICQDDLQKIFVKALDEADESIYLVMYSLNDDKIIRALNQRAKQGLSITVIHDPSTPQSGYNKLKEIKCIPMKIGGLMHKKILITDQKNVWIGSANFTYGSLQLHDNLIIGLTSPELATTIVNQLRNQEFKIGGQELEFWNLPRDRKAGLTRLIGLIEGAQKSIRVAMYTWTHPELTNAIITAYKRGVDVEIILDRGQANGAGRKAFQRLINAGVPVWLSSGQKLLHHKFLWVDNSILASGSANWTRAAFSRNQDCFIVIHTLTEEQIKKLNTVWSRTRTLSNKQHLLVFWQRPQCIRNHQLELVYMAA